MSLKSRLRITILAPLMALALGYSMLSLSTVAEVLFREASEVAMLLASQVQTLLVQRVTEYSKTNPASADIEETKRRWREMALEDRALSKLLEETMSSTRTVTEIDVTGADGLVLASSNPNHIGKPGRKTVALQEWQDAGRLRQIWRVLTKDEEYEASIPLGLEGQAEPLFRLRVMVSSILLRNTLDPEVRNLLFALGLSLMMALALAFAAGSLAFFPLRRLAEAVDKVSRGEALGRTEDKDLQEMQVVESKLSLLGEQVRGAKEDLKQMRGNVERLLERMEDAVLLFDQDERLVNAGRAVENFLDRNRFELPGLSLAEIFPVDTPIGEIVQSAVTLRRPLLNAEARIPRDGQEARRVQVNLEILDDMISRENRGFILRLRDAEAQISLSKQLDVGQRLSALNKLTSGVAHEIKNPLNSIGLHLEVLRSRMGDEDEVAQEELKILRDETRRLDRVVKTFLDFTKPVELKLAPVDLAEILNGMLQFLMPESLDKKVAIGLECETRPAIIRGDSDLLKQAFLNLIRNGMEAMPEGGPLAVHVKQELQEVVVTIADRGVGIPEASRAKIFQLYYTTKESGTGIGLAVTYRVVQLHNGSITFESKPGQGTEFELRFPTLEKDGQ
jgi:signal transduction histidine kinase